MTDHATWLIMAIACMGSFAAGQLWERWVKEANKEKQNDEW